MGSGGLRANAIVFTNGGNTLELRAGFSIVGNVVAGSSDTLALGGSTNAPFDVSQIGPSAQYQDFGNYMKTGSSTWTLINTTSAVTPWTIQQGILSISSDANLGNAGGAVTLDGGTLQATATFSSNRLMNITSNNGNIDVTGTNTLTLGGVISGSGALTKTDTGTLVLTGNNSYAGTTTIAAGILQVGVGGTSGTLGTGATVDNGTLAFDRSDTYTFGGVISGTGSVQQIGPGTTVLTGNSTYTGGTTITAGTLQLGNGGASGSIVGNVTDNGTLALDRSDTVTYSGVISGTGAVQQVGPGTMVLTGNSTYTGGTTISAGTLQLGNGAASGSIVGNVTDNGTLAFNRSDAVTFGAVISGTGSVQQNGSGTTTLSGINSYTGGTIVNAGTLTVNSAQALGLGDVVVNGGTLNADPRPINVHGNYTQNASGTLELQVAGANSGQYDFLSVGGNAAVGGTLQLISLGFQPTAGNQLTLVTSGGAVTGRFARFGDPFTIRPGLNTINLVRGRNSVVLQFLNLTTPVSPAIPTLPTFPSPPLPPTFPPALLPEVIATVNFASFALTPNQLAAANLLNEIQLNPKTANLFEFLYQQPISNLPAELEKISPDGLTAFYEITFSNANIQRLNLEGRLDDLRSGSTGFSSNMKVNGAAVSPEGKATVDGKTSKGVVEPMLQPGRENRWGVWVTGFGDFVNVDADGNANGYNFTTGGFTLGVDYRISDQLAIGAMGEYAHT
jgi:outer membrane autotransporter protein